MMSWKEKSAWVVVAGLSVTYGAYFVMILNGTASDPAALWQPLAVMVVSLVVLLATGHAVLAAREPKRAARHATDRRIDRDARATGGVVLAVGSVAALLLAMAQVEHGWVVNVVLAALVGSELAAGARRIVAHRRRRRPTPELQPGLRAPARSMEGTGPIRGTGGLL